MSISWPQYNVSVCLFGPYKYFTSTEWVETFYPLRFSDNFSQRFRIFKPHFTHVLRVPIYAKLQNFIQLSLTMTKLCKIKVNRLVNFCIPLEFWIFNLLTYVAPIWVVDSYGPNKPRIRWGSGSHHEKGPFWGSSIWHPMSIQSLRPPDTTHCMQQGETMQPPTSITVARH